jgi:DNA polymerase V
VTETTGDAARPTRPAPPGSVPSESVPRPVPAELPPVVVGRIEGEDRPGSLLPRAALEAVHAGFPSPAQGYYSGPVDLNRHLMRDPTATFLVRVSGDSMTGAGIFDGDELVVDRGLDAHDGNVVVAVVNAELTVKRLSWRQGRMVLSPENPAYPEIVLSELDEATIWGVVTRCLHRV